MPSLTLELLTNTSSDYSPRYIDLDILSHVHKRVETFKYLDSVSESAVPLSYVAYKPLKPETCLKHVDQSFRVEENSTYRNQIQKFSSGSFTCPTNNVLFTNQVGYNTFNDEVPLFYKHKLEPTAISVTIRAEVVGNLPEVEIIYVLDLVEKFVYINVQNEFNKKTGSYRVYKVYSQLEDGTFTDVLLNTVKVVNEGTWEDIDLGTGLLTGNTYSIEESGDGFTFLFAKADMYYAQFNEKTSLSINIDSDISINDSWHPKVSNGVVHTTLYGKRLKYWVPEYWSQPFSPSVPYYYSSSSEGFFVNKNLIKTRHENLYVNVDSNIHFEIEVYDVDGILLKVLTTDTSKNLSLVGIDKAQYFSDKILSFDYMNGFVNFAEPILTSWTFKCRYFYKSNELNLSKIELNPIYNSKILNHMIVLYVVPNVLSSEQSIHYLLVNEQNKIIYASQRQSLSYIGIGAFDLDSNINPFSVIGTTYSGKGDDTWLDKYCYGFSNANQYLVLGELYISPDIKQEQVFDVQEKRITEDASIYVHNPKLLRSVYGHNPQTLPRNNLQVISYPSYKEEDVSIDNLKRLMNKFTDLGMKSIFRYSDPVVEFSLDTRTSNKGLLTIFWEGPGVYNIYRRESLSDSYVLLDQVERTTRSVSFTYEDLEVDPRKTYIYKVTLTENGNESKNFLETRGVINE